ncbi:MAG: mandelate racemase/muconate lactonizing enzyme family protein [Candidatus Puniceispirillaceae bacterium]
MKLIACESFVVGTPPPGNGGRYFIFVKLTTDNGIIGYGEIYAGHIAPHLICDIAKDSFARHLCDQSPFHIEAFMRKMHGAGFLHRPDPTMMGVASGLEMAMWDIIGKALDQPVANLLGGMIHERLRTYTYLYPDDGEDAGQFYADPIRAGEKAAYQLSQGFTAVKCDPAGQYSIYDPRQPDRESLTRSARFCQMIREAVGDKADILFGTHGQFTPSGAIRMAQAIAPYDPLWFEEPTPPDLPEEMALVAQSGSVPVSAGERLCTLYEFQRLATHKAASIWQPNLGRAGGLLEGKKIAAIAQAHYCQIAPHLYCGPLVAAANAQLAATLPNFLILESIEKMQGFHAELLIRPLQVEDGYLTVPTEAGLGVTLNEEVARAHPYEGEKYHLEMAQEPFDAHKHRYFPGG